MNRRNWGTNVPFVMILGIAFAALSARDSSAQIALGTGFTYQGSLVDGGSPASGSFDLQFDLRDAPTDGGSLGVVAIEDVAVTQGVFTVALDFGAQFDGDRRWLEIGVRPGADADPHQILSPRVELSASPHSLYASRAGIAADAELLDGMDSSAFPDGHSLDASDGDPTDALAVDEEGNVGIGMSPVELLAAADAPNDLTLLDEHSTGFSFPNAISAGGDFVYVVNRDSGLLQIFDISDPSTITPRGSTSSGLARPTDVVVAGSFAYVTDFTTDRIQVFDVSDPDAPAARGSASVNNPEQVEVVGTTALVMTAFELFRFSVTDPDFLSLLSSTSLSGAITIVMAASGTTTYIAFDGFTGDGIEILDGAVSAGSVAGGRYYALTMHDTLDASLLYALSETGDLDVYERTGTSLALQGSVSLSGIGFFPSASRTDMIVDTSGRRLYVGGGFGIALVDISDPMTPVPLTNVSAGSDFVARNADIVASLSSAPARLRTFEPADLVPSPPVRTRLAVAGHAIKTNGGTSWLAFSDARLKRDVAPLGSALGAILGLNPVSFHFNDEYARMFGEAVERKLHYGFLAQEYREAFPEDVRPGPGGYLTLDGSSLDPYLVRAIQELKQEMNEATATSARDAEVRDAEIERLRAENAELLERLARIESRLGTE